MADEPTTRASMVARLADFANAQAWQEFDELYGPLLLRYARRRGLQEADARDAVQDISAAVARSVGSFDYDPQRGRFRAWLFTIARRKLLDLEWARQRRDQPAGGSLPCEQLSEIAAPDEVDAWEQDWQRRLFELAVEKVRPTVAEPTWRAFWMTAVEGRSGDEVALELKMSRGRVHVARCRVQAKLKEAIHWYEREE